MCTVSWFETDHGYELFFNRDELRARQRALRPRATGSGGDLAILAPVDADAGGTWLATNAAGMTVALLNRYQDSADPTAADPQTADRQRSRGLLVKDLAGCVDIDGAIDAIRAMDLTVYAPFTLLLIAPQQPPESVFWNGQTLSDRHRPTAPLVSSGFDTAAATAARRALWSELPQVDRRSCVAFHSSHRPEKGAESPCMHRPEARTVSLTHVVVDDHRVSMAYADGPPCRTRLQPAAHMELRLTADVDAA